MERSIGMCVTWGQVMPWLARVPRQAYGEAVAVQVADPASETWTTDLLRVAAVLAEERRHVPLADSLVGLDPSTELVKLRFGNRVLNIFTREKLSRVGDVLVFTPDQLRALRNMGDGALANLVSGLISHAVHTHGNSLLLDGEHPAGRGTAQGVPPELSLALLDLATWNGAVGLPAQTLGQAPQWGGQRVVEQWNLLMQAPPSAYLPGRTWPTAATMMNELLGRIDPADLDIIRRRRFANERTTLDAIGTEMGVTREWVRQREKRALGTLQDEVAAHPVLGQMAAVIRDQLRSVVPLDDVLRHLPALRDEVPRLAAPAWRLFDQLDDSYEIADGWCAAPSLGDAQTQTRQRLADAANAHGVAPIDVLIRDDGPQARRAMRETPSWLEAWLSYCGIEVREGMALLQGSNMPDRAAAILSLELRAMPTPELLEMTSPGRAENSLRNALAGDERFIRTDRDTWGLAEWGIRSYSGIRDEIGSILDGSGGEVSIETLVEMITGRFAVSQSSVRAYASSYPYQSVSGVVRRCGEPTETLPSDLSRATRVYQSTQGWTFRFEVTRDHMRGSGFQMPTALGRYFGLLPGGSRELQVDGQMQNLYWTGLQPTFGTMRVALSRLGAAVGDIVHLRFCDSSSAQLRVVPRPADPGQLAAALVGEVPNGGRVSVVLASAVGLPQGTSLARLGFAYRERGDSDVVECIEQLLSGGYEAPATN